MEKQNSTKIEYYGQTLDIEYTLSIDSGDGVSAPESTLTIDAVFFNGKNITKSIKEDITHLVYEKIAEKI